GGCTRTQAHPSAMTLATTIHFTRSPNRRSPDRDHPIPYSSFLWRIRNDDDEILGACLLQAVRAARTRQDRGARPDCMLLPVERQLTASTEHVVHLVDFLLVRADRRTRMQRAFAKNERGVRRLGEERIAGGFAAAIVRSGL